MGFAVVAVAMAEKIGVVDFLNARVAWDPRRCKVSPGERLLALIIGCLVDPMALYRLEEFYTHLDGAVLVGAGRQAHDFNDEVRGRALVKLFESQVGQTFAGLSLSTGTIRIAMCDTRVPRVMWYEPTRSEW